MKKTWALSAAIHRRGGCTSVAEARAVIGRQVAETLIAEGEPGDRVSWLRALNGALRAARGPLVLLLSADVRVTPAALAAMARRLSEHPDVGAVGPVLIGGDGARRRCFGRFYWPDWVPATRTLRVPLLSLSCLMTRADVVREIGVLRDDLLLPPNEEYEWCARLAKAGYRLERVPERVVCRDASPQPVDPVIDAQRGFLYLAQSLRERPARAARSAAEAEDEGARAAAPMPVRAR
ncbi:MAG: glycosyltransferase [Sandaracinaceae bacterium]|nr:glycosyltransferase [Sandaracinaceae bacterium]